MKQDIMAIMKFKQDDIDKLERTLNKIDFDMQSIKNTKHIEAFKDFMVDIIIDFIDNNK